MGGLLEINSLPELEEMGGDEGGWVVGGKLTFISELEKNEDWEGG